MQQSVINTPEKMKRTFIKNAIIVNEGRQVAGSVVIEGEKIAEISYLVMKQLMLQDVIYYPE